MPNRNTVEALTRTLPRLKGTARTRLARRLWTLTAGRKDTRVAIARLEHDDQDLHRLVGEEREPGVRAAWLANSTVADATIDAQLAGEHRAAVLASAISQSQGGRNQQLNHAAAERLKARPTIALAEALIDVDTLDDATSVLATVTLLGSGRILSSTRETALNGRIARHAADHSAALLTAAGDNWVRLTTLIRAGATVDDTQFAAVTGAIILGCDSHIKPVHAWARERFVTAAVGAIDTLLSRDDSPERLDTIEAATATVTDNNLRSQLTSHTSNRRAQRELLDTADSITGLRARAETGDVTAMAAVCRHRDIVGTYEEITALATLADHNLPLAAQLAKDSSQRQEFTRRHLTELHDAELLAGMLGDTDDERRDNALAITALLLEQARVNRYASHYVFNRQLGVLLAHSGTSGIDALNWSVVADMLDWNWSSNDHGSQIAAERLLERLGDDDERWHTFTGLSNQWTASLGELLDATDALVTEAANEH